MTLREIHLFTFVDEKTKPLMFVKLQPDPHC